MSATGSVHNKILGINRPARAFDENGLRPAWKKLIETYPDQIMIGTDACCGWFNAYSDMVQEIRNNLLPYLSRELIEKVAYKNAVRIFNLKEWWCKLGEFKHEVQLWLTDGWVAEDV